MLKRRKFSSPDIDQRINCDIIVVQATAPWLLDMSVRKRSWKSKDGKPKEAWIVDYFDQAGARHIKTFRLKKEADAYAASTSVEIREGTHTADSASVTVAEAGEKWLETARRNGLEASTVDAYRQHLELHIKPFLGRLKLPQVSRPIVRQFEDDLLNGKPAPGEAEGRARSPAMTRKIITSLGSIFGDASDRGLVARNPVRDMRSSRKRGTERRAERRQKGKLKVGVDIPTREEIRAIIAALPNGRERPILLTAIFTGVRASELRGLRWADVDFKRKELHVRQRADRYNQIGPPKSEAGERTVPLPPTVLNALKEWKLACPKSQMDLAFPTSTGNVIAHKYLVAHMLGPVEIAAGVTIGAGDNVAPKYPGLHALRHFYASWLINRKADGGLEMPPKVVQERMGHSSIMMTMDVYGHLFPRGDDSAELAEAERSLVG